MIDRWRKAVIPARWTNGQLEYFYGGSLPKLREGGVADVVVVRATSAITVFATCC